MSTNSIVLPEADDPRTLEAIEKCIEKNVIKKAVLLGEEKKIRTSSSALIKSYLNKGVLRIIDSQQPEIIEHTKTHLLQRLEAKNKIISEKSLTAMANAPNYQAGYILSSNEVALSLSSVECINSLSVTLAYGKMFAHVWQFCDFEIVRTRV